MSDIDDIIANAATGEYSKATDAFNAAIQDKINDSLDQYKSRVASQMFSSAEEMIDELEPMDVATIEQDDLEDYDDNDALDDDDTVDDVPDQDDP